MHIKHINTTNTDGLLQIYRKESPRPAERAVTLIHALITFTFDTSH